MQLDLTTSEIVDLFKKTLPSELSNELALYYQESMHPRTYCVVEAFGDGDMRVRTNLIAITTSLEKAIFEYLKVYGSGKYHQYDNRTKRWTYDFDSEYDEEHRDMKHYIVELRTNQQLNDERKVMYIFRDGQLRRYNIELTEDLFYNSDDDFKIPPECRYDESFKCPIFEALTAFQFS